MSTLGTCPALPCFVAMMWRLSNVGTVIVMRGSADGKRGGDGRIMPNSSIAPSYEAKTFTE
jgi:hypothetical protein